MKNETNTQHTPAPWVESIILECRDHKAERTGVYYQNVVKGGTSHIIAKCFAKDRKELHANAQLIARAPELLKENEQLKEKILRGSDAFKHESARFDKEWSIRKKTEAINAELLEAIKNVIGDISASYGFDARRIPNESVKKALLLIDKVEGKNLVGS